MDYYFSCNNELFPINKGLLESDSLKFMIENIDENNNIIVIDSKYYESKR